MDLSKFYFVDIETGGLDSDKHDIVSICVINNDRIWTTKIKPMLPVSKEAAELNGYDPGRWTGTPTFADLEPVFQKVFSEDKFLVAHNAKYEYRFLTKCAERAGFKLFIDYHVFCTAQLAMEHLPLKKVNLRDVCDFLGIFLDHHEVRSDTEACREVFKKLYRCSTIKRLIYRWGYKEI